MSPVRGRHPRQEAPSPRTNASSVHPSRATARNVERVERVELNLISKYHLDASSNSAIFNEPPSEEWAELDEPNEADVRDGLRIIWRWANSRGLLTRELATELTNLADVA